MPIAREGDLLVLSTAATSYALALESAGTPVRHLWWGPRISLEDAARLEAEDPAVRRASGAHPVPDPHTEEYPIEGGLRHGELALRVARGVPPMLSRGVAVGRVRADVDQETLRILLADDIAGLEIELGYEVLPDHDVIRRWTTVRCNGPEAIEVTPPASAHVPIPRALGAAGGATLLITASGAYGTETVRTTSRLTNGTHVLATGTGTPGHRHQPFAAFCGDGSEESGPVRSIQLAWNGEARIAVHTAQSGLTEVACGIDDDRASVRLEAGEEFFSPSAYLHATEDGLGAMSRAWHRLERERISPRGRQVRPVIMNSWEATFYDIDESNQRELATIAADLGAELFMVDDGWFAGRRDDTRGLGDWWPDPERFPRGMRPLADHVHGLGMRFGIWMEPEMANPGARVLREHPDWAFRWPDREPTLVRHQVMLDFSRPEVRDWAVAAVDRVIREGGADMIKWDMNRPLSEPWATSRTSPRIGHARGLTEVWGRLRELHPRLLLETCQSGGGRADLASLGLAEWAWASDDTDAIERLAIQDGYSLAHGAHTMSCWVTDCPNTITGRTTPLELRFHVAMQGVLGLGGDISRWGESDRDTARRMVRAYRRHRATIQLGELHRSLRRSPSGDVTVRGYRAADGSEAVVLAVAPAIRLAEHTQELPLGRLVDPDARYRIARVRADADEPEDLGVASGSLLAHRGLRVHLRADHASTMHVLTRIDG